MFTEIGTLQAAVNSTCELCDINGDGSLDAVIAGYDGASALTYVYTNNGTGGFTKITNLLGMNNATISSGDIDGDSDNDMIICGQAGPSGPQMTMILQNDGTGYFTEINAGSLSGFAYGASVLGDLDNDGDLDYILSGSGNTYIYRNDGTGAFTEINAGSLEGCLYPALDLADLDADGDLDLIATGNNESFSIDAKIYQNNGSGAFTEIGAGSLVPIKAGECVFGDIDGDNDLDMIISGKTNTSDNSDTIIYQNDGSGAFTQIQTGSIMGLGASSMSLGDLDGDGDLDLIISGFAGYYTNQHTKIYLNDGTGSFTEKNAGSLMGLYEGSVELSDLDNDSDLDIVLTGGTDSSTPFCLIYENDGNANFTQAYTGLISGVYNGSAVCGDVDGDSKPDIVISGQAISKIYKNYIE